MQARLEPVFLDGFQGGRRFALWVLPAQGIPDRGSILCVQAFGDEANLSRRVLVAQATRLAAAGWTTLLVDLFGTGDSDGATDEASLDIWRADLLRASRVARERVDGPFVLWGLRMGALLASELAIALDQLASGLIFWQPPSTGAQLLDPLLKLASVGAIARDGRGGDAAPASDGATSRAAADGPSSGPSPGPSSRATASDGQSLARSETAARGATVDLAGYRLQLELVEGLRTAAMQPSVLGEHGAPCPVLLLAMQRVLPAGAPAPKAVAELAQRWLASGHLTSIRAVQAEPFWASLEPSLPLLAFRETEIFLEGIR